MKKNIFTVAIFAASISVSMIATSCSDDICEPGSKTSLTKSTANADKVFFMYGPTNNLNLGVKFDGDKAAILKCANPETAKSAENNAEITYTSDDKSEGYFTMQDNSLGVKKINFVLTDGLISLNFSENKSTYDGGKVFLDEQSTNKYMAMSRATGETQTGDVKYPEAVNVSKTIATKLLTLGAKYLMGDFGEAVCGPMFEAALGGSGNSEIEAKYDMIQSSLNQLNAQMQATYTMINLNYVTEKYRDYWYIINQRRSNNKELYSRIKLGKKTKFEEMDVWAKTDVKGDNLYSGPMTLIKSYMLPYADGRYNMDIMDEYVFNTCNWESQGYEKRDLARMEEFLTFTELLMLYKEYKSLMGETNFDDIEKCMKDYFVFYAEHYFYKKHTDKAVCQIDGSYFVTPINADKDYTRVVGQAQYTGNHGMIRKHDTVIKNYFDSDGDWKYTYLFSDKKMSIDDEKAYAPYKEKCLQKSELEAIVKHSNNRNVFDVLRDDAKMTKLTDDPILLKERFYCDWVHKALPCVRDAEIKLMGSVWEKNGNKYNNNYEIDDMIMQTDWWWSKYDYMYIFKSHSAKKFNDIQVDRKTYDDMIKYERELMSKDEIKKEYNIDIDDLKAN